MSRDHTTSFLLEESLEERVYRQSIDSVRERAARALYGHDIQRQEEFQGRFERVVRPERQTLRTGETSPLASPGDQQPLSPGETSFLSQLKETSEAVKQALRHAWSQNQPAQEEHESKTSLPYSSNDPYAHETKLSNNVDASSNPGDETAGSNSTDSSTPSIFLLDSFNATDLCEDSFLQMNRPKIFNVSQAPVSYGFVKSTAAPESPDGLADSFTNDILPPAKVRDNTNRTEKRKPILNTDSFDPANFTEDSYEDRMLSVNCKATGFVPNDSTSNANRQKSSPAVNTSTTSPSNNSRDNIPTGANNFADAPASRTSTSYDQLVNTSASIVHDRDASINSNNSKKTPVESNISLHFSDFIDCTNSSATAGSSPHFSDFSKSNNSSAGSKSAAHFCSDCPNVKSTNSSATAGSSPHFSDFSKSNNSSAGSKSAAQFCSDRPNVKSTNSSATAGSSPHFSNFVHSKNSSVVSINPDHVAGNVNPLFYTFNPVNGQESSNLNKSSNSPTSVGNNLRNDINNHENVASSSNHQVIESTNAVGLKLVNLGSETINSKPMNTSQNSARQNISQRKSDPVQPTKSFRSPFGSSNHTAPQAVHTTPGIHHNKRWSSPTSLSGSDLEKLIDSDSAAFCYDFAPASVSSKATSSSSSDDQPLQKSTQIKETNTCLGGLNRACYPGRSFWGAPKPVKSIMGKSKKKKTQSLYGSCLKTEPRKINYNTPTEI